MSWRAVGMLVAGLLGGSWAHAQPNDPPLQETGAGRAVVVVGQPESEFTRRVQAELTGLGYRVQVQSEVPRELSADTAAIVVSSSERVDVWLVTGQAQHRELHATVPRQEGESDSVRVAERLRALFQELPSLPAPPAAQATPPAEPSEPPPPTAPQPAPPPVAPPAALDRPPPATHDPERVHVDAAVAAVTQPGGAGLSLALGAGLALAPWLSAGPLVVLPIVPTTLEDTAGSATISVALFGGEAELAPWRSLLPALSARVGVAAAWVRTSGRAQSPFDDQDDALWTALPYAGVSYSPQLSERLRLRASVLAGVAAPRAEIRFADQRVDDFGRPLLLASLGLSFGL